MTTPHDNGQYGQPGQGNQGYATVPQGAPGQWQGGYAPAPQAAPGRWQGGNAPAQMQQGPGLPAGMGVLRFIMPGNVMTSSMVAPTVTLNGQRLHVTSGSGTFDFPVPAGTHRLHAHGQWMKRYGDADIDFSIQPGQMVEVYYAAPLHQFASKGNIGFTPQKKPGLLGLLLMLGIPLLLVFLMILVPLFL